MTLCIASHAQYAGDARLVLCFDSQIGDDYGTTERAYKCYYDVFDNVAALYAGSMEDADDLVRICKDRAASHPLTLNNFRQELWGGMAAFKEWLAECRRKASSVQLLVSGFVDGEPRIAYLDSKRVWVCPLYTAIGTGGSAAHAMLKWRKVDEHSSLEEVLYFSYEAKRFSEPSPFVGKSRTDIVVLKRGDTGSVIRQPVTPKGLQFLEEQFDRLGPQKFNNHTEHFPVDELL